MIQKMKARVALLRATLAECDEFATDRHDVEDGADGKPRPNEWMQLSNIIDGEPSAYRKDNVRLRALLDRAAHIVTGCAALLCERGCQDETDLDAFAAEIRKALEEKP